MCFGEATNKTWSCWISLHSRSTIVSLQVCWEFPELLSWAGPPGLFPRSSLGLYFMFMETRQCDALSLAIQHGATRKQGCSTRSWTGREMMNQVVLFVRKSLVCCCWGRQYVYEPSWSILWSWGRGIVHTLHQRTSSLTGGWGWWWSGQVAALPPERSHLLFSQSPPRSHMVYCSAWRYRWSMRRHTGQSDKTKARVRERAR